MGKKWKDLPGEVTITNGFPGQYIWLRGSSWYLDGFANQGEIHFTVNAKNDDEEFSAWHMTRSVERLSNVGIWFHGADFSNVNTNNLPSSRSASWTTWWDANKANCELAAKDFWHEMNK